MRREEATLEMYALEGTHIRGFMRREEPTFEHLGAERDPN